MLPTLSPLPASGSSSGAFIAADALDAKKLNTLADNQLVSFLHNTARFLRGADLHRVVLLLQLPSSSSTSEAAEKVRALVKALLSSNRFAKSTQADVAQLVACILCDAIRLHAEASSSLLLAGSEPASETPLVAASKKGSETVLTSQPSHGINRLPFPLSSALDVLRAIARPFQLVCEMGGAQAKISATASGGGLQRCDFVIERAAASHALLLVLPACLSGLSGNSSEKESEEVESILQCFFSCVEYTTTTTGSVIGRGDASSSLAVAAGGKVWSATLASEMARILGDILSATNSITEEQLRPLLTEIIAASPALNGGGSVSNTKSSSQEQSPSALKAIAATPGAAIASRFFLEQIDVIQPTIASVALGHLEQGVEKLVAVEFCHADPDGKAGVTAMATASTTRMQPQNEEEEGNDDDDDGGDGDSPVRLTARTTKVAASAAVPDKQELQRRKHPALREIARALEIFTAMMELNVNLCVQLVPTLLPYLSHELAEVRLLMLRGFVAAWASNQNAFHAYHSAFLAVLHRFNDVKPTIRAEAVESAGKVIATASAPARRWPTALVEEIWAALRPFMDQRLTDPHVLVRLQTVQTYTDVLAAIPAVASAPSPTAPAEVGDSTSAAAGPATAVGEEEKESHLGRPLHGLAATVGLRTADKNARVRERAVERLCHLYCTHSSYFPWIPDSVLRAVNAEGGVALVERHFESALPSPTLTLGNTGGSRGSGSGGRTLAVFDFEKEDAQRDRTYVDAVVQLCRDMHDSSFAQLLALIRKKPQLRLTIQRLFELRAQMKAMTDPKSPQGQTTASNIHRLLTFLQGITHAEKGEWDALFRARDDRIAQCLQSACQTRVTNWKAERAALTTTLKGRLVPEVYRFVSESLARQMMLPLELAHLSELLEKVGEAFTMRELQRRQCSRRTRKNNAKSGIETESEPDDTEESEMKALLRTLLLFVNASPSYFPRCTDTLLRVLESVTQTAAAPASKASEIAVPVCSSNTFLLLLQFAREWAAHESAHGSNGSGGAGEASHIVAGQEDRRDESGLERERTTAALHARGLPKQRKHDALSTLGQLCLGGRAAFNMSLTVANARSPDPQTASVALSVAPFEANADALSRLSEAAAETIVALISVPAFGEARALSQLVETLSTHLADRAAAAVKNRDAERKTKVTAAQKTAGRGTRKSREEEEEQCSHSELLRVVAWLHAVRSFAENRTSCALVQSEALVQSTTNIFLAAVADSSDRPENERLAKRGSLTEKREQLFNRVSVASATTAAAAKAIVSIAVGYSADRRQQAISSALDTLLAGYKQAVTQSGGARSVGACQRRLAIELQLVRVLVQPSADIGKELAVAVILSAEDEEVARDVVQKQLTEHLLHDTCDMRYAAFLLMSAMGCESRSSYQDLKNRLVSVGDHLRRRQAATGATLSEPAAMQCYLEYSIPFLILFMSHHTFYEAERTSDNFTGYQRVWHLLFEELFRHGTQCASFVVELLGRIKCADDVLDRGSNAHRVLCDLCSRVMLECLGQRQTSADALKRFPGAVLLPNFFAKTAHSNPQALLSTIFLDSAVPVAPSAPFRVLTTASSAPGAAERASRSASQATTPRHSVARSTSRQRSSRTTADAAQLQRDQRDDNETADVDFERDEGDFTPRQRRRLRSPTVSSAATKGKSSACGKTSGRSEGSATAKRRRRSESSEPSAASSTPSACSSRTSTPASSLQNRQRPAAKVAKADAASALAEGTAASSDLSSGLTKAQLAAVHKALDELLNGLRKPEIAQLRWKAVKARIESGGHTAQTQMAKEAILDYAKEQLRVRYEAAEP